ncbi:MULTISPECIES: hypothetical protein [unclassified Streptomyces]|uniref:hypothetical protein n=1 Tax=unclassified Streptomyces TaxID=2593676 RepID=UPI000AD71285|nr:hypothetical protein [Streptomyces sp. TSRI0281]
MIRARKTVTVAILAAFGAVGLGVVPAAAATTGSLLPHPGPDGLVWVPENTGDGGVVSAGASDRLATVITVACEGGGSVSVTMASQATQVAAFEVDCPEGSTGVGSVAMDPGVVQWGSFSVGIDASDESIRWGLTVTQPE